MTGWVHTAGTLAVFAGGLAASLFVVAYQLTARWWASQEGWHLMSFTACLGLILDYSSWRVATSQVKLQPLGVEIVRTLIFVTVAGMLVWRLAMLYQLQIRPLRAPAQQDREERDTPATENAGP